MKFLKETFLIAAIMFVSCIFLNAQETGGAKGKIKNADEKGIAGVEVSVEQNGKTVRKSSTDKSGAFTVNGSKSGKYNFTFSKTGFATGTLNNVEVKEKDVRNLGNRMLEVDEGMLVLIKGSVFDQDGKSVDGAKIEIERISGNGLKKLRPVYSGEGGDFTFRFPEGAAKFRITASLKGKSTSKEIEVEGAAIYRLALTLSTTKESEN